MESRAETKPNHHHIGIKWPQFRIEKLAHKKPSHGKQSRNFDIVWITLEHQQPTPKKKCLNYEKLNKV